MNKKTLISIALVNTALMATSLFVAEIFLRNYRESERIQAREILGRWLPNESYFTNEEEIGSTAKCGDLKNKTLSNLGLAIDEGCFIHQSEIKLLHHDEGIDADLEVPSQTSSSNSRVWIFGDSWGNGIKNNELQHKTISNTLAEKVKKIRIISAGSWSPILYRLALRDRIMQTREIPDILVFHIDQTDMGNDFCQYRPYSFRRKENLPVDGIIDTNKTQNISTRPLIYFNLFNETKSGFEYILKRTIIKYGTSYAEFPGLTSCQYADLLAYQRGDLKTKNGSSVETMKSYFSRTLGDIVRYTASVSPSTKIIFTTHDWYQHHLPPNNPDYFPGHIYDAIKASGILNAKNVSALNIGKKDYLEKEIDWWPGDRYSHLTDYKVLSESIAKAIKRQLTGPGFNKL